MTEKPSIDGRTWFRIDGELESIEFDGPSFFRFPYERAAAVITQFSESGGVILDPFCGFGTSLVAAAALDRVGIGVEKDLERFEFASRRVREPSRVVHASALDLTLSIFRSLILCEPKSGYSSGASFS